MRTVFDNKKIKKILCEALYFIAALCMLGCARAFIDLEAAKSEGARLKNGVIIDGVSVGGLTVDEAWAALEEEHKRLEEETVYLISSENGSIELTASELPTKWNTEQILLEALNKSYIGGDKEHYCTMSVVVEKCRSILTEKTERLAVEPQNARIKYKNGVLLCEPEKEGSRIDVAVLALEISKLRPGLEHELQAASVIEKPSYTEQEAKRDSELLASYTTSFAKGSYGVKNRVFNIKKAANMIDGFTLEPGETFDMNALLGARNKENGWKEATAIREGSYVQEYGGGVCQVSTTLYNAALMADLEITERRPHSWPLGYVDIGRDATISTGGPNFCFVNTTEAAIYISARTDTEEQSISVSLYGRKRTDGLSIKLRSKKVESIEDPGDEIRVDKSLKAGERIRLRESRSGSVSETYKQYYGSDGTLIREELVTRDKYRPIKGIILRSDKKAEQAAVSASKFYG